MWPNHEYPKGRLQILRVDSRILKGNPLKDPTLRELPVYIPTNYNSAQHYPLFVELAPYGNSGLARAGWKGFGESVPQRLDRLIATEKIPPIIVAFPDCYTRLGGNQYVNSPSVGNYDDHIREEIVPLIENNYPCGGPGQRVCFGKSSGGYGALMQGLNHGDFWAAVACHSGDIGFENCVFPMIGLASRILTPYEGDIDRFLKDISQTNKLSYDQSHTLMLIANGAFYDPCVENPKKLRLPFDLHTGEILEDRWQNWQAFDLLHQLDQKTSQQSLNGLKSLFIDCGSKDQYDLQFGARRLEKKLKKYGIPHFFEEFDDNHSSLDYRLDISLPYLAASL
ncbi:MAG: enterochelin esterase [bacterium]|nr:enterochelin esterase [bacterium]